MNVFIPSSFLLLGNNICTMFVFYLLELIFECKEPQLKTEQEQNV